MTILNSDIKLFASERLADTSDGGGRMTSNVVVDGAENNLFDDISELDRVYGRVSLRKAYMGVDTATVDRFYGAHAIVAEAPTDPRVSLALFSTESWIDERQAAQSRMESYLAEGPYWSGFLFSNHIAGQRAISLIQRETARLPAIGEVLVLTCGGNKQYVKVTTVQASVQTFTVSIGGNPYDFTRRVVVCEITDPLRYDFTGESASPFDNANPATVVRSTVVADAAQYFGMKALTADRQNGDLSVNVGSIFHQLVPSSQAEVGLVDIDLSGAGAMIRCHTGTLNFSTTAAIAASGHFYVGTGVYPGSLSIACTGATLTDAGGKVYAGSTEIGTIDYTTGALAFNTTCGTYSGSKTVTFTLAVAKNLVADTAAIAVEATNRAYTYTITLHPTPTPGAVAVDYMAQGKWYTLRDQADGTLRGADSSYGAGTVNYATGSVVVTLGALPDVGSEVIFSWATPIRTFDRHANSVAAPVVTLTTAHAPIVPSTLTVTWGAKSVTDNGHGVLTGDGTGTVEYSQGKIYLKPTLLPNGGQTFSVTYQYGDPIHEVFEHPTRDGQGRIALTLGNQNVLPDTIQLVWNVVTDDYYTQTSQESQWVPNPARVMFRDPLKTCRDDGSGHLLGYSPYSSISYQNGTITWNPDFTVAMPVASVGKRQIGQTRVVSGQWILITDTYRATFDGWSYENCGAKYPTDETGHVEVTYRTSDSPSQVTETFTLAGLTIDLTDAYAEDILAGSARFTLGGLIYVDRAGALYHTVDHATNSGTYAGTTDYVSGVCTITVWTAAAANTVTLSALATTISQQVVDEIVFRTPGAPLRPQSVSINCSKVGGGTISSTSDEDGLFSDTDIEGTVNYETGVVRIRFGNWITASGHEAEVWYQAGAVRQSDGKIFKPQWVVTDTLTYNCVVYSYLPLDAEILGLDPVRLPSDGRVPIFKKGQVVVVHHTGEITLPNPVTSGYVAGCSRTRLARVRLIDSLGAVVSEALYTVDLDAGTVTFNTPPGLGAYTQPITLQHTVEDTALATDVELSGKVTLNRALSHTFPHPATLVSSALIIGDSYARYTNLYEQTTWTGVWSDTRIGDAPTPSYNDVTFPLTVKNEAATTERWAVIFTSSSAFRVVGEFLGQIATGNINEDCEPTNPANSKAYFKIDYRGWGGGWSTGNCVRFNTLGANYPLWVARTVLPGPSGADSDTFRLQVRGGIDQ